MASVNLPSAISRSAPHHALASPSWKVPQGTTLGLDAFTASASVAFELRACLTIWAQVVDLRQRDRAVARLTKHIDFLGGLLKPNAVRYLKTLGEHAVAQVKSAYQDQLLEKKCCFVDRCLRSSGSMIGNGACARTAFRAWQAAVHRRAVCQPRNVFIKERRSLVRMCLMGVSSRWLQLGFSAWCAQVADRSRQREVVALKSLLAEQTERCKSFEWRYHEARTHLFSVCSTIGAMPTNAQREVVADAEDQRSTTGTEPCSSCRMIPAQSTDQMTSSEASARFLGDACAQLEGPVGARAELLLSGGTEIGAQAGTMAHVPTRSCSPVSAGAGGSLWPSSSNCRSTKPRSLSAAGASAEALLQDMRALSSRVGGDRAGAEVKRPKSGSRQLPRQRATASADPCCQQQALQEDPKAAGQEQHHYDLRPVLQSQHHSPMHSPRSAMPRVPPLSFARAAAAVASKAATAFENTSIGPAPVPCRGQCTASSRSPAAG